MILRPVLVATTDADPVKTLIVGVPQVTVTAAFMSAQPCANSASSALILIKFVVRIFPFN